MTDVARRVVRLGGLLAVQVAVAIVLLEIVARVFDPLGISYYPETARFYDQLIREEPISYRLPPGMSGTFYGVPVQVNSLGMRDSEVPVEKPPGEIRVLLMGDSVPFGVGVRFEDSIPYQLEQRLNSTAPTGLAFRVLNMGVPSYNTEQELLQLQNVGLGLQPDIAVLMFTPNDIEPKDWVYARRARLVADVAQRSYALSLLYVGGRYLREHSRGSDQRINMGAYQPDHPRWLAIETSLAGMVAELRPRDIPLLVLFRGLDGDNSPPVHLLRAASQRIGFHFEIQDPRVDLRWDPGYPRNYTNSIVDSHCNPLGCAIQATAIAQLLQAFECMPGGCRYIGMATHNSH